ncbi:MAG: hypothetical protein EKK34_28445 [Mycobacterium sp.]|nr:MAG: hypothetical protein EKK34_28445 [Mycobacterium sp.]
MTGSNVTPELVHDSRSLANFLVWLAEDFECNKNSWQNITIASFLEALSAWLDPDDMPYNSLDQRFSPRPSWSLVAEMLLAAKYYE